MPTYLLHPEFIALRDTVLAFPCDDAPRLILSDWLEDHGQEAHAHCIRDGVRSSDPRDCGDIACERGTLFLGPYDPVLLVPPGQCLWARGFPFLEHFRFRSCAHFDGGV
jgi:uncharacterized protein (TIGR02996 family)